MNEINKDIDNYMYELEDLSVKMAKNASMGNFLEISKMDKERKNIINKISVDAANIQTKHKKKLKLIWNNNNILINEINDNLEEKKQHHNKIKKTLKAYNLNN